MGRSRTASSVLPPASTVTTSVPAVGHVISTDDGHTVDVRTLRMKLPPPPPTRLLGEAERMIDFSPTQSLCTDNDTEPEPEPHPFATVPGMEDCPLAGLESALARQHSADAPSVRQTALWTKSRGGSEVRAVKTFRIDALYTGPDGTGVSAFQPLDMPQELPLSHQQWQHDNALKKQQKLLGCTARALSKGLERMERWLIPLASVQELANSMVKTMS